jgi:hypothetical protein
MGDAYTPGLTVTRGAVVRRTRRLPLAGETLVAVGAKVAAHDVVARTELPGKVTLVNVATGLGVLPDEVAGKLVVKIGDAVARGQAIARTKSLFGWISREVAAPVAGTLEAVSAVTGMAVVREPPSPVEVTAYVGGTVVDVIAGEAVVVETVGALVQGIFGLAGERHGAIAVVAKAPDQVLAAADLLPEHRGKVVLGGARATLAAMRRALELEVAAIVCGGFAYEDVRDLLGHDVGVAVTGNEPLATTLVVTEGFGDIAMARATYELLASLDGRPASVTGATQIRAGVIRPEIVVPQIDGTRAEVRTHGLELGAPVRCIRAPYFGKIGKVSALPVELAALPTETRVRVVEVDLGGGETVTVPRANVEVIEA